MVALYADEPFPRGVVNNLRVLGHDILTVQEADNRGDSDEQVVIFAKQQGRAVLTINRKDFIRIHRRNSEHTGIIICKQDLDWQRLATNIDEAIDRNKPLGGKLVRVRRQPMR